VVLLWRKYRREKPGQKNVRNGTAKSATFAGYWCLPLSTRGDRKNQDDCQLFPRKRCSNYQGLWFRCRPVAGMGDPEIDGGGCSRRVVAKSVPHASRLKRRKQVVNARVVGARLGQRELLYLKMGHCGGRSRVQGRGDVRGDWGRWRSPVMARPGNTVCGWCVLGSAQFRR
jgi:hypothetical protein